MNKVNIAQKLEMFDDLWSPRIVGQLNGQHVKLAKIKGAFDWHHHAGAGGLAFARSERTGSDNAHVAEQDVP